jgi:hypothetical protein
VTQSGDGFLIVDGSVDVGAMASWSYSFMVDSNPIPITYVNSAGRLGIGKFAASIMDFQYYIDGYLQPSGESQVLFWSAVSGGGYEFGSPSDLGSLFIVDTDGAQLYTGQEQDPTIITGTFSYSGTAAKTSG